MLFLRLSAVAVFTLAVTILACVWFFASRSTVPVVAIDTDVLTRQDEDDQEDRQKEFEPPLSGLIAQAEKAGSAPESVKALTLALRNQDEGVRQAAAWALGKIGAKSLTALQDLNLACNDRDEQVRDMAKKAHDRIAKLATGEPISEEEAQFWSKAPRHEPRPANSGPQKARGEMPRFQKGNASANIEPDLEVVFVSTEASTFFTQEPDDALKALIAGLKDSDASVRQASIQTLGKMGEKAGSAIPALIDTLKDKEVDVRGAAAMALGRMGKKSKGATTNLAALLADADRDVRCAAALALSRIGKDASEAVPDLVKMAKSDDKYVQVYACCALAVLDEKTEPHVRVLADALTDPKTEVRGSAAYVLGELGSQFGKTAIPALAKALKDQDKKVRRAVALALGEMGSESKTVIPSLTDALKDGDPDVRSAVAMAIGEVGPSAKEAVPALIETLKDKENEVRGSAVFALGEIGPAASAAIPALSRLVTQDEDAEVRRAAALAIGKIQE